tara:strand:- start:222 stop:3227 length:3006 start_codon:yes stop_codon:yes gene_type:complete
MPFVPDNNTSGFIPDNSSYSPEGKSIGFVPDEKKKNSWLDAMWSGAKIGFMDTARGVQQIAGINEEELAQEQRELNSLMEDEEVGWAAKTGYFGGLIADPVGWMLPVSRLKHGKKALDLILPGAVGGATAGALGYVDEEGGLGRGEMALAGTALGAAAGPAVRGVQKLWAPKDAILEADRGLGVGDMAWTALKTPEVGGGLVGAGVGYNTEQDATTAEKMQNAVIGATLGMVGGAGLRVGNKMSGGAVARALIPDWDLTEEWIAGRSRMMGGKKIIREDFETLLKEVGKLKESERKVLYGMLTTKAYKELKLSDPAVSKSFKELSAKSRETVNKYAKELADLGVIRDKTFFDNIDTYLHRTYDNPNAVAKSDIPSNINNIGDASRLRGYVVDLTGKERKDFIESEINGVGKGPDNLGVWSKVGDITEKRFKDGSQYSEGNTLKIRRDWTSDEKAKMGEVTDAHKALLRTGNMLAEDVSRFRFFKEMSEVEGISSIKKAGLLTEKLPDDIQFGALRGRYVSKATEADLRQIREINALSKYKNNKWVKQYRKLNSYWKGSKTIANPAVHFNNLMSNVIHYDNGNGTIRNFFSGLKNIKNRDAVYREAEERGVFGGFFSSEIGNESRLTDLFSSSSGRMKTNLDLIDSSLNYSNKVARKAKNLTWDKAAKLYNYEDQIFRMGLYRTEKERLIRSGMSEKQAMDRAARKAREWFVDYSRSSPVLDVLREGPLPFVSYMYGVIPKLAETAAKRPIKFAKWGLLMGALNETGEVLSDADSEKQQRRLQDAPMYGIPGMPKTKIKLPDAISPDTKDDWYFDIERMLPGGNLFEGSEGSGLGRVPYLPQSLQPSMGAAGAIANTAMGIDPFRQRPIDDRSDYLTRQFVPNLPVPIQGFPSFSSDKLTRAFSGEYSPTKDVFTPGSALASTLGAKLTPVSDTKLRKRLGYRYDRLERELKSERRTVRNNFNSGVYGAKSSQKAKDKRKEEMDRITGELRELSKKRRRALK